MGIARFEERLERGVEGFFGRVFRSGLRPVELGRKLEREIDHRRTVGVGGRTIVPNSFTFTLSSADRDQLADMVDRLRSDLADAAREHARDEGYRFTGPVEVIFDSDEGLTAGLFRLDARFRAAEGGAGTGVLVLPDGTRVPLGEYAVSIGRGADSVIVLGDPNVSRRHAEVRPRGDGYVVVDLGSTNGTRVNGALVSERPLADGDVLSFGATHLRFETG